MLGRHHLHIAKSLENIKNVGSFTTVMYAISLLGGVAFSL